MTPRLPFGSRSPSVARGFPAAKTVALLLAILLVGGFLRFHHLGLRSLWLDEAYTWDMVVGHDWRGVWAAMLYWSNVSPLPYVLLKLGLPLFGTSEFALRLTSAFAGWLAIPATYRLGRAMFGSAAAWLAAAIVAFSPFAVWYAQEARAYGLYLFLAAWSLWGFVRAEQGKGWKFYIVASAAAYLTHYVIALYIYAQAIYCLTQSRRKPRLFRRWALAQCLAILPVGVWIVAFLFQRRGVAAMDWIPPVTVLTPFLTLWNYVSGDADRLSWPQVVPLVIGIPLMIGLMVSGIRALKSRSAGVSLLLWWLLLPLAAAWLFSLRKPSYVDRYFEPGLLTVALLVAAGVVASSPRWRRLLAIGVAAGLLVASGRLYTDPLFANEDWRSAARLIESLKLPVGVAEPESPLALTPYVSADVKFVLAHTEAELSYWQSAGPLVLVLRSPHESAHALAKSAPFDPLTEGPAFFLQWRSMHPAVPLAVNSFAGLGVLTLGSP